MKIGKFEVNKKLFITFVVVVGLTIILLLVRHFVNNRYEKYKLNKNEDYIYDYVTYSASETSIPYINLNTEFAKVLNGQLEKLSSSYKNSNSSTNSLSYRFNVSGNYLSLVLIFKKMDSSNRLQFDFKSYVFDLSDGARALSDTEILNLFNIDNNYVEKQIDNKLKSKYLDEVKKILYLVQNVIIILVIWSLGKLVIY